MNSASSWTRCTATWTPPSRCSGAQDWYDLATRNWPGGSTPARAAAYRAALVPATPTAPPDPSQAPTPTRARLIRPGLPRRPAIPSRRFLCRGFLRQGLSGRILCGRMPFLCAVMLRFVGVLLRLEQMLLQLLLRFPAPTGRVAEFPCGLGAAYLDVQARPSCRARPCGSPVPPRLIFRSWSVRPL